MVTRIHPTHERFIANQSCSRDIFLSMISHGLFPKRKESTLDRLCDWCWQYKYIIKPIYFLVRKFNVTINIYFMKDLRNICTNLKLNSIIRLKDMNKTISSLNTINTNGWNNRHHNCLCFVIKWLKDHFSHELSDNNFLSSKLHIWVNYTTYIYLCN